MVKFESLQPGILVEVECKAYAMNIEHDRANRLGMIHFEMYRLPDAAAKKAWSPQPHPPRARGPFFTLFYPPTSMLHMARCFFFRVSNRRFKRHARETVTSWFYYQFLQQNMRCFSTFAHCTSCHGVFSEFLSSLYVYSVVHSCMTFLLLRLIPFHLYTIECWFSSLLNVNCLKILLFVFRFFLMQILILEYLQYH